MPAHLPDLLTSYETGRLHVRAYRPGDGAWYYSMCQRNKCHLARFEAGNPVMGILTEEQAENLMSDFAKNWAEREAFFMGAFLKENNLFAAQVYIGVVNWELPEFEVGYFVDVDHEGHGYVTEAVRGALHLIFTQMGAQRVRLECDDTNLRSIGVARRCGMVQEAHFRENKKYPDGSISGTLVFGLLRREFLKACA